MPALSSRFLVLAGVPACQNLWNLRHYAMRPVPKHLAAAIVAVLCLTLWPVSARADIGIPVVAVFWPATWVLFIPVVLVEALVARQMLGLSYGEGFKLSLKANAWSTFLGVPLASVLTCVLGLILGSGRNPLGLSRWLSDLFFGSAVWMDGVPNWALLAGPALICVPCYVLSVWIETWSASKTVPREDARRWAVTANLITYGVPVAVLIGLAAAVGTKR
jgi:hypothetical protein